MVEWGSNPSQTGASMCCNQREQPIINQSIQGCEGYTIIVGVMIGSYDRGKTNRGDEINRCIERVH